MDEKTFQDQLRAALLAPKDWEIELPKGWDSGGWMVHRRSGVQMLLSSLRDTDWPYDIAVYSPKCDHICSVPTDLARSCYYAVERLGLEEKGRILGTRKEGFLSEFQGFD